MKRLQSQRFSLYGSHLRKCLKSLTWKQLIRIPGLFARAEDSGCEGCYVEIAKWNRHTGRYERFAFDKFFGGELWQDASAETTAARVATMVNLASRSDIPLIRTRRFRTYKHPVTGQRIRCAGTPSVVETIPYEFASIIHTMPTWNPARKAA
jgi:hypothetical protein